MRPGYDPQTVLQRVLLLERQQGFNDRAAVGGIERFTQTQIERATDECRTRLSSVAETLTGYAGAERHGREVAIAGALSILLTGAASAASAGAEQMHPGETVGSSVVEPLRPPAPAAEPPRRTRPHLTLVHQPEELDQPTTSISGMRKPMPESLERLGVRTIRDLLYYLPRAHYDYTDTRSISRLRYGEKTTLVGRVENIRTNRTGRGLTITTVAISDDTGTVPVRFFNQPFIAKQLPLGARVAITGEPDSYNGFTVFEPRDYELIEDADLAHAARLVPMYPLTKGLYQRSLRRIMHRVVHEYAGGLEDHLPSDLVETLRFPSLQVAIRGYHFPEDEDEKIWSQQRLAFDELLLIQLGLLMRKQDWQQYDAAAAVSIDLDLHQQFRAALPFALTAAQENAIHEIYRDLAQPAAMSRLLQGDVGSGKTVVAAAAIVQIVHAGRQAVVMAPTEILADQHCRTLNTLLAPLGIGCELLVGSTPRPKRKIVYEAAQNGSLPVLVGTHAVIQEGLEFAHLGLAVTDEQHRFGVEQRGTLRLKGISPHVLAMTATPIPRTLSMTIYGDLDVSVIDQMPPGRVPPITTWSRTPAEAYGVVRDEVRLGHQAFVICPVIEDTADTDMRSVLAEHRELSTLTFPDLSVGLLHGRMKPRQKEEMLAAFRDGEYQVLVATSVVEVGIDIPNATVMVIRDAHRFGLAQLHQFRGRVGRGGDQAYCVLLSNSEGDAARERLEALTATENGFELAEQDLKLRGPGEFWGTRQSGLPELRVATLGDLPTIQLARQVAQEILDADPQLQSEDSALLRERVERFWSQHADLS